MGGPHLRGHQRDATADAHGDEGARAISKTWAPGGTERTTRQPRHSKWSAQRAPKPESVSLNCIPPPQYGQFGRCESVSIKRGWDEVANKR
jgi:hypothetical protein